MNKETHSVFSHII